MIVIAHASSLNHVVTYLSEQSGSTSRDNSNNDNAISVTSSMITKRVSHRLAQQAFPRTRDWSNIVQIKTVDMSGCVETSHVETSGIKMSSVETSGVAAS